MSLFFSERNAIFCLNILFLYSLVHLCCQHLCVAMTLNLSFGLYRLNDHQMFLFYFFCTEQRLCSCVDCDFTKKVKWPSNCIRMTWDQDGVAYVCVLFSGEVISSFDYFAVCSTIIFAIDFANFKIRILTACVFLCFCIIHSLFCFT